LGSDAGKLGAADDGPKTLAVVALSGWQPLMDDINYLGGLAGKPQQAQGIEGMINLFTQGKGLQGLDRSKPWGVVVQFDGGQPVPVICLPIDDLDGMLQIAQAFGVVADDAGGGVKELSVPQSPQPLFAKQDGAWVYVSQSAEALDAAPADPTDTLSELVTEHDLAARVLAQNVPAIYRQMAVGALRQGLQEGLERESGETDEEYEARRELAELQLDQMVSLIEDMETLSVGIAINEEVGPGMVIDFSATAVDGSELAEQMVGMRDATTNFAGFMDESATMHMNITVESPPELVAKQRAQAEAAIAPLRKQMLDAIDKEESVPSEEAREIFKSAANDLFDVYAEVVLSGNLDAAIKLNVTSDSFSLLGGAAVASPEKVESALKKLSEIAKDEPNAPAVNWNAESHSGITFHTIALPVPPGIPPAAADILGDTVELAFGIGEERVYVAAGKDWLSAITAAMDASAEQGPTLTKPMTLKLSATSIAKLATLMDGENQAMARLFADALAESTGDDHISLTIDAIERGFRYRLQIEEGVLRAAGGMAEAMARQAGAGRQPPF
ncbi:MAG: hypothetical protein AAGF31_04125, partial [Planctomycetota bacterium]